MNNPSYKKRLNFERAFVLNPTDEDIQYNIKIVQSRLQDKIEAVPVIFYKRWYTNFTELFTLQIWTIISILSFAISLFLILAYLLTGVMKWKKTAFYSAIIVTMIFVLSIFACQRHYNMRKSDNYAIVFTPTVTTKSSPDEDSKNLFIIHEGTKLEITDVLGEWYEIKLANGSVAWLRMSDVEII
jgi:hypothetical protein